MGKRLDTWLDEECRMMTVALTIQPSEYPTTGGIISKATGIEAYELASRLLEFREAMRRSYRGQCLLLADQFEEAWEALPRWARWPSRGWARLLRLWLDPGNCCPVRKR